MKPGSGCSRRPGDAGARSKVVSRRSEGAGHARVPGKDQAERRIGKDLGLLALDQRLQLIEFFKPGANAIPAHAIVEGEFAGELPAILREGGRVQVTVVETACLPLRITRCNSQQKVGKVHAGLRAIEGEAAVEDGVGMRVDLVRVNLAAELEPVIAENAREEIADLVDVLGLHQGRCIHAHGEVVEGHVGNAFRRGLQRDDADESLRDERGADAALGLTDGVGVAHVAQVEFVERCVAESDGVAKTDELREAVRRGAEAGHAGAAGAGGIGIEQRVAVNKVVAGERSLAVNPIGAQCALVVLKGLGLQGCLKDACTGVLLGDGRQEKFCRRGPRGLRNLAGWKDRGPAHGAAGGLRRVWITIFNAGAEFARQ